MNAKARLVTALCSVSLLAATVTAADSSTQKFHEQSEQLNSLCAKHSDLAAPLSKLIHADDSVVQQAMEQDKKTPTEVLCAQIIAEKINKPVGDLLGDLAVSDWSAELAKHGITLSEVADMIESVNMELAFTSLEQHKSKQKRH